MSGFSFPDHCSYCTKEFHSKHCLFPYALVVALPLPEENKDKAEYLTKLHHFLRKQITNTVSSQLTNENLARLEAQMAAAARPEFLTEIPVLNHHQIAFYNIALAYYFRSQKDQGHMPAPTPFTTATTS